MRCPGSSLLKATAAGGKLGQRSSSAEGWTGRRARAACSVGEAHLLPRHAQAISGRGTSPLVSQSWKGLVPCALAVSNEHLRRLRRSDG
mmetsp:Transcript_51199/g.135635  ORF Transcript_51199/g.135635 Transcript_51199/m.135635 type:complete len:89 (+) Transcript_51199:1151-1417(+)